jgi:hypothetical protein
MNYENISLSVADNGFILDYCVKRPKELDEDGCVCCCDREYKKRVYSFDEGASALAEMKKMHGTNKAYPMKETPKNEEI